MKTGTIEHKLPEGTQLLVIREGQAEPIYPQTPLRLKGDLAAPVLFAQHTQGIDTQQAYVLVDPAEYIIKLVTNRQGTEYERQEVTGELRPNPFLEGFKIAVGTVPATFSLKELADHLRMRRMFFANPEQCREVITLLQDFRATSNTEISAKHNERNGSRAVAVNKQNDFPTVDIKLRIPLWVGRPASEFFVQINGDVSDNGIRLWLESVELRELLVSTQESLFQEQVNTLKGLGYLVIYQ